MRYFGGTQERRRHRRTVHDTELNVASTCLLGPPPPIPKPCSLPTLGARVYVPVVSGYGALEGPMAIHVRRAEIAYDRPAVHRASHELNFKGTDIPRCCSCCCVSRCCCGCLVFGADSAPSYRETSIRSEFRYMRTYMLYTFIYAQWR